jgi:Raf kinase inhibitor-like YbhB/YbcL family protein
MRIALVAIVLIACGQKDEQAMHTEAKLAVSSAAFAPNAEIPTDHTCDGVDTPPPIAWTGAPPGTQSFAVIVDDPDAPDPAAPKRTWVHYVIANIPATTTSFSAAPPEATVGTNDWGKQAWGGPCPPIGRHRYFFKVYALDTTLPKKPLTKAELESAMSGHVLAKGELVGTYQKKKS